MPNVSVQVLEAEAMKLSPKERGDLAERLFMSLTNSDMAEHDAAWDAEIRLRATQLDRGEVDARPWATVMKELHARYG